MAMDLPMECVASTLALTSPRDVKRLALVNKTFLEASKSDLVWRCFLPSHWQDYLQSGSSSSSSSSTSLMQVYENLCEGVPEEGNKDKIYMIDRSSGFLTRFLSAAAITVVWGDTPHYWEWIAEKSARFDKVAYLRNVCWLEVRGTCKGWWNPGKYRVAYRLRWEFWDRGWQETYWERSDALERLEAEYVFTGSEHEYEDGEEGVMSVEAQPVEDEYDAPQAREDESDDSNEESEHEYQYGGVEPEAEDQNDLVIEKWCWSRKPLLFMLEVDDITVKESAAWLCDPLKEVPVGSCRAPSRTVENGWIEFEIGDFVVEEAESQVTVGFHMTEIAGGHWKSGLLVEGVIIRQIE